MRRRSTDLRDVQTPVARLRIRRSAQEEWAEEGLCEAAGTATAYVHVLCRPSESADSLSSEQVETLLRSQDSTDSNKGAPRQDTTTAYVANTIHQGASTTRTQSSHPFDKSLERLLDSRKASGPAYQNDNATTTNGDDPDSQWEMIGLGLEEPLPPQDVMDEL